MSSLFDLTGQPGMVVAPSAFGKADSAPVGAGPFKFVSYQPGATLKLQKVPGHWEASEYKIDGIEYRQTGTGNPAVTALRAGDIDVIYCNGFGFPRHRGGPMFYADTVGLPTVLTRVRQYREQMGDY